MVSSSHDTPQLPDRMIFRLPWTALLPVVVALVCATPFAFGAPGLQLIYLVPLAFGYWVLRTRTLVDGTRIVVRKAFGRTAIDWSDVSSLRISERGWVRAVLAGEVEVPLLAVRTRHLPVLAAVSGGRVIDPLQAARQTEHHAEEAAAERPDAQQHGSEPVGSRPAGADRPSAEAAGREPAGREPAASDDSAAERPHAVDPSASAT